jgi:hypothetical protein
VFGCEVINPPVFLSEDEARQVIQEEAKRAGLDFAPNALTIKDATVPVTEPYSCPRIGVGPEPQARPTSQTRDLVLDGFDRTHNVGYELVSYRNFNAWNDKNPQCRSSVTVSDLKGTADSLRIGLKSAAETPWLGVFYEPSTDVRSGGILNRGPLAKVFGTDWQHRQKVAKEADAGELRKQVHDFISWLKAQGVI